MSQNPYENEPGFEDAKSEYDKKNQEIYVAKVSCISRVVRKYLNHYRSNMKL